MNSAIVSQSDRQGPVTRGRVSSAFGQKNTPSTGLVAVETLGKSPVIDLDVNQIAQRVLEGFLATIVGRRTLR